jgi:hypothetical protein
MFSMTAGRSMKAMIRLAPPIPWAAQPIRLIDLFDEAGPPVLEGPRDRGRWCLEEFSHGIFPTGTIMGTQVLPLTE